jgi:hypothetical protein
MDNDEARRGLPTAGLCLRKRLPSCDTEWVRPKEGASGTAAQAPGVVVLRHEMIHESRVIPLDGRPHPSASIKLYMGDSRGHWEGDTLVVETTNFTDKVAIGSNGAGYPGDPGYHSEALRLVERFTRTSDNTLDYTATVNDPQT